MPEFITINGRRFERGACGEHLLNRYVMPSRTPIDVPVFVFRSKHTGPVVLLQAGMHGDETNGIETLRNLLRLDAVRHLERGSLIVIPILNVVSFLNGSRDLPDERDLNRCFPGSRSGSLGSRIAHDLMKEVVPQITFGVDFHTGGAKINNYPQIRCLFDQPENMELARHFGAPFTVNAPFREKSFRKEAARKGKNILVFEAGESLRFNKLAIQEGLNGILRLLHGLGMSSQGAPESQSIVLHHTAWVRAKRAGLFRTQKKYGSWIEKDEVIGTICDPFGEWETPLLSPINGFIIGINNQPVINEGDAIMHLGEE